MKRDSLRGGLDRPPIFTERKRAEEAVREQTERLQLGQAAMRMIIMDWNVAEDRLTWSESPEWLRGPLPANGRYPLLIDQVHPEDRDTFLASRSRALETLQVQMTEFRWCAPTAR
jgi:PAS domain-containing protein